MRFYQVGGCVRDRLLGQPVADRDWVVIGATPEEMQNLGFRQVGKDFPVFLHPETHEEYALGRTERKTGRGYYGFTVDASPHVSLPEDLRRRDLTINAMAESDAGEIIDPYNGRADLAAGVLRHVSHAFVEDPLRVLRVARFAARFAFSVAPETMDLMSEIATSGELETLAPERVWNELERALLEAHPEQFIRVLRACGALAVLFPEIDRLFGVPQTRKYHPEIDTGEHLCLALQQCVRFAANSEVRFAVLVHDLGKGTTEAQRLPGHHGHEERGVPLVEALCERFRVPRAHRDLARCVTRYHLKIHRAESLRPDTLAKLLVDLDALRRPERFEQILLACEIDATGRAGLQDIPYHASDYLRRAREATASVSAQDLLADGVTGEELGAALHALRVDALRGIPAEMKKP